MGTIRLVVDAPDRGVPAEVSPDRLSELLTVRENRVWLDISDPGPDEVALLRRTFGFHELALEDMIRPHERPRCDCYAGYHFVVVYAVESSGDVLLPRELNLFWGENYLVTIHRRSGAVLAVLEEARRRWERHEGRRDYGVASLAYTLFESLVDGYFSVQDGIRGRIDGIEEAIFTGAEGAATDLFRLRKELLRVPRLLAPTSQVLAEVLRRDRTVPEGLRPYFADVQDHALHVLAELDTYRDLLGAALGRPRLLGVQPAGADHEAADRDHRHHHGAEFVASMYGMNFAHIPAGASQYGFVVVAAFLLIMVAWGFIHSRMLGWL
jgi:magnesium transporter